MTATSDHLHTETLRSEIRELLESFPNKYWRDLDAIREYPYEFVDTLTKKGYLSGLSLKNMVGKATGSPRRMSFLKKFIVAEAMPQDATRKCTRWAPC
ncbi:hypothetical protein [Geomicrobium sp. JCM 19037]|uniref:hypothetical protein n=1 Tax=Geomicrobium sp. JCM 19037 TaxID=1460634 RepID=UPI001EE64D57|nr:hypothetical protein [Geomicrobium sp. JCM 19037]